MIDIDLLRKDPDTVRAALAKRQVPNLALEPILDLDRRRRELISGTERKRAARNEGTKEIARVRSAGSDATELQANATNLRTEITALERELAGVEEALLMKLAELPNLPDERVPAGGKERNQVVQSSGKPPAFSFAPRDHVTLCKELGLVDYERGVKLGGSGFWIYTGLGAALEWALLDFFCREHFADGYTFMLPPHLLLDASGFAAGQFPKFRDDVFHLGADGGQTSRFLLPTSETAILNVYRDESLDASALPIKAFAYSPCYRREAGAYRTEERGTVRGHQFNKVEMFQFVLPEDAENALDELLRKAQKLMDKLGLHYRTSLLAAADTSASMAMTYDVEVWLPSMNTYKEVSSVSWARDYQARRANIRYQRPQEKSRGYVHTLNASGLATSRLLPAIVEQFQREDGGIVVPEPLRPWLGRDTIQPVQPKREAR